MPSDESVAQSPAPSRHLYIGRVGEACLTESKCSQTTNSELISQPFETACASFLVRLSPRLYMRAGIKAELPGLAPTALLSEPMRFWLLSNPARSVPPPLLCASLERLASLRANRLE